MANPFFDAKTTDKKPVRASCLLSTGDKIEGQIYVMQSERLQDLLNGPRQFIPYLRTDLNPPEMQMINKSFIVYIREIRD